MIITPSQLYFWEVVAMGNEVKDTYNYEGNIYHVSLLEGDELGYREPGEIIYQVNHKGDESYLLILLDEEAAETARNADYPRCTFGEPKAGGYLLFNYEDCSEIAVDTVEEALELMHRHYYGQ
jgi:hypothetical protein